MLTVLNIATKFEYNLSDETAKKLVKEEPNNFKIITEGYVPEPEPQEPTSTYNKVVVREVAGDNYEEMTKAELKTILTNKNIEFSSKATKDDLIKLLRGE